ncbi:hypothetical protein RB195_025187 [Necator americanus]|uniref:Reverse transcriptase domain-containing protein n=1 Tax=Necator americanus TaxID=51031 RepID=A0ABR1ER79_NECAM
MMRAKKIKYDVIGLIETRRPHPLNAVYETGEELFLGTCESRGVGGVGVLVNTSMAMNIDFFEQLTTRIGRLRMRRCAPTLALTVFVAYAPTSSYEEEVEAFYTNLEKFFREDHAFCKVIIGDFTLRLESPDGGYHNEIDHIIVSKWFCLTDVVVVPKIYAGSDHRLLRERFSFTRKEEKVVKFREQNLRATINWDLFATLADFWEDSVMDKIDKEYDRLVEHLHDFTNKAEFQNYQKTIENVLDEGQPCEHAGFRKGFSTIGHIHTVSKLIEVSREYKMSLCLTFIDLKKAFDSAETEAVVDALDNQGIPAQYIKVLRELYRNFTTGISLFYKNIIIDVKRGVRQGDSISPKIFTTTIENAMRKLELDDMGVKVDGRQLHHLRFADDIVLITSSIS